MSGKAYRAAVLTFASLLSCPATAAVVWDEFNPMQGVLSDNPLAPTVLNFAPGANDVIGYAGQPPGSALAPFKQDFFTFTVPNGYELTSLIAQTIDLYTPGDAYAFIGIQTGSTITHSVSAPDFGGSATGLLGWLHIPASDQGDNILPSMGSAGDGAIGFAGPLPAGQYAVWMQDDLPFNYDIRFEIGIAEPSTWIMLTAGFAGLGYAGLRRQGFRGRWI
jgi:hypothetical protein